MDFKTKSVKQEVARNSQASRYRDSLSSGGWNEIFIKVANQLDAVHSSATRISSSAESLGAVEYEARLSAAVQVLILYVDHIKVKKNFKNLKFNSFLRFLNSLMSIFRLQMQSASGKRSTTNLKRRSESSKKVEWMWRNVWLIYPIASELPISNLLLLADQSVRDELVSLRLLFDVSLWNRLRWSLPILDWRNRRRPPTICCHQYR